MADTSDPNRPPQQRPNPSIESTRKDDEHDKAIHEEAEGAGAALGTGLGCLGIALGPWAAIIFAILAAIVFIAVMKSCGK
jgi:hypothetical protein